MARNLVKADFKGTGAGFAASRFFRNESGSMSIFTIFVFMIMFMVGGMAVDIMRFESKRIAVQGTLDRAVLAAADLQQTIPAKDVVDGYFAAAGLSHLLVGTYVNASTNQKTVAAQTTAQVDSLFMQSLGIPFMSAPAMGAAEESVANVEISMVLDISGSMGQNNRLVNLKGAAKDFVGTVLDNPGAIGGNKLMSHISIVPFNHQVNAGATMASYFNFSGEHNASFCVDFSTADYATTAISPTTPLAQAGHFSTSTSLASSWRWSPVCQIGANREIQPFSTDVTSLQNFIDGLSSGGYTSIDVGTKWGAALLDPAARGAVSAMVQDGLVPADYDGRPSNFGTGGSMKVLIVMSDGENTYEWPLNAGFRSGPSYLWYDPGSRTWSVDLETFSGMTVAPDKRYYSQQTGGEHAAPYGTNAVQKTWPEVWAMAGVGWMDNNVMSRVSADSSIPSAIRSLATNWDTKVYTRLDKPAKDPRTSAICTAAKSKGVIVYTIGFETNAAGDAVLSSCASSPSHFFHADGTQISDAFSAIATQIKQLKLIN